jgi:hypothetical protein
MYPNKQSYIPKDSLNIEKHKNLSAEYMRNYRKSKAQKNKTPQASTSTDPTPTPIICNYNQANEYFQKNFIGNPFGYACNICGRLHRSATKNLHRIFFTVSYRFLLTKTGKHSKKNPSRQFFLQNSYF